MNFDSTRVKIDLDIISRNFDAVCQKAGVPVMAVVKADTVFSPVNVMLHFGVPAFGLMSEMTPGFEQIVYSEFRHDLNLSVRYGHFSRRRETAFLLKCSGKFRVLF